MLLPPFDRGQTFFRGNLHGHSTHSDGEFSPLGVAETYRELGYDFTCLSDHLWKDDRFCAQTVLDSTHLDSEDFITVPSAELHCHGKQYDNDGLWHIVANGLPLDFAVAGEDETGPEMVQRAVDAGAYVSIAHPEWYILTNDEAKQVSNAHAVEIYNHSCAIESSRGYGIAIADFLLNEGHRVSFTATDDSHFRTNDGGGGWVMVAADQLDAGAIIDALKAGHHYSSTGPEFHYLAWDSNCLMVECSAVDHICISGSGHVAQSQHGSNITRAIFDLNRFKSDFFRVSIIDRSGRQAWSNPYFLDDLMGKG